MIEAGVALYEAAGKRELLEICIRLADCIVERFMHEDGIPGHQEIELALMRLYRTTGNARYRDMAMRFLDLRGQNPAWFEQNTPPHPGIHYGGYDIDARDTIYNQSDVPVRKQTTARGHAVRQVYMLTAMADAAQATGDSEMRAACERMFDAITQRQMYVTGAIGASAHHESFTVDYDLPPDRCYGETCASVAMAFFAKNMLALEADGRYADLLELEIYNAALAGMQLDGKRFFYVNPLSVDPAVAGRAPGYEHVLIERPQWHACACCPPNLARLITSLGGYLWSEDGRTLYSHLLIGCELRTKLADISVSSAYPWEGCAVYAITRCQEPFVLAIHIPSHAMRASVQINGKRIQPREKCGYAYVQAREGDVIELRFDMSPRRIYTDPRVTYTAGKVALARGPLIYCFEGVDNPGKLTEKKIPKDAPIQAHRYDEALLGGVVPLETAGLRAVPYYAWSNRGENEMSVFIEEKT